jgi:hypothetical protein
MEVGNSTDEQLAQQYQPGTDLGDTLRSENPYLSAQNRPNIPAAQPQDVTAPDIGTFSQRFADAADRIGVLPGVSGWAKSLVASAVSALPKKPAPQTPSRGQQIAGAVEGIGRSLGDAAAVGTVPAGGGALTGVFRTLAARGERLSNEESQRILRSESQARTIAVHRNIYRQDRQDRLASYKQTADMVNSMREDHNIQDNISQSELNQMLKNNPEYFHTHSGGAVGERPVFDANGKQQMDSNGSPVYEPVYALAEIRAKDGSDGSHDVNQAESEYFKRNTGTALPVGTKLTTDQFVYLYKKAHGVEDTRNQIQKANDGELSAENLRQVSTELQDPSIQHYTAMVPGNPLAGLGQARQNVEQHIAAIDKQIGALQQKPGNDAAIQQLQTKRQQFTDEDKKINHVVTFGFNDAAKERYAQQAETARHNRAEEANKAAELAQKKQQGIVSNLIGDDYLKTLPVAQQVTVRAVGEGRQLLPANRKEALALLEQVHQAYPDYDESKGKTWQKVSNEYRGSGQTAKKVVSYNTALEHMQDLYNNTTAEGIFNPVSKSHQDREVAMGYVANEVGNAIKNGVMSKEEGQKILADLSGGITPANKRERIAETARLLHDKIEEYQNKFNEGAPSSAVKVPLLISPRAAASYDFVQNGGKSQTQPKQPPTGATHKVPGPDGKMHWTNAQGTVDYGVVQ